MAKVQRIHCDSLHCTEKKPHVLAILRFDMYAGDNGEWVSCTEKDIKCTDSITNYYVNEGSPCYEPNAWESHNSGMSLNY